MSKINSSRKHRKNCFYKYTTIEAAKKIIVTNSFRWSSPIKFNDPFDTQIGFVINFTAQEFEAKLVESIERCVFSRAACDVNPRSTLSEMVWYCRLSKDKISRPEFLKFIRNEVQKIGFKLPMFIDQMNKEIQIQLCHSRVFCVTERHNNVVMWSHYADEHRGIVFKLGCLDEIDNSLLAAQSINYTNKFKSFLNAEKFAKKLTGEQFIDISKLIWEIAYLKHSDWAYEKEWRVHIPLLNEQAEDGFSIIKENSKVFQEVYIGCRMNEINRNLIINLIKQHLPETKIFQATRSTESFSLKFTEIK